MERVSLLLAGKKTPKRKGPMGFAAGFKKGGSKPGSGRSKTPAKKLSPQEIAVNKAAARLPFETLYFADEEFDRFFDTTEKGWVDGGNDAKADQPDGLGILEKESEDELSSTQNRYHVTAGRRGGFNPSKRRNVPELLVYVDPLTFEPISATYDKDEDDEVIFDGDEPRKVNHDYWFRVKFKVKLKKQPGQKKKG